jgi:aspartate carbamoyltransferase catalytic subunit
MRAAHIAGATQKSDNRRIAYTARGWLLADQQRLLREAIQRLRLTRDAFALEVGVSRRALDTWLLPPTSKQHRTLTEVVARMVASLAPPAPTHPAPSELRARSTKAHQPPLLSIDQFESESVET